MIEGRTGRSPHTWCPPNIHDRRRSRRSLERDRRVDKTRSDGKEVKRKEGEKRGGDGGGSITSDRRPKRKQKRNNKKEDESDRKRATLPRSDHFWSRSLSPGGEGRPRGPEQGWRVVRWVGVSESSLEGSGLGFWLSRTLIVVYVSGLESYKSYMGHSHSDLKRERATSWIC